MKKKILSAILCATTLFGAVGFSACEVTDVLFADYKEQIAELQETLNAQQEKIAYFEAEVAGLQETIDEQEEQIATLEQEKEKVSHGNPLKINLEDGIIILTQGNMLIAISKIENCVAKMLKVFI